MNSKRKATAKKATIKKAPVTKAAAKNVPFKNPTIANSNSKTTSKRKIHEESDEESEEDLETDDDEDEVIEVEKKPIFTVFKSDEELDEGLCIVRSLGEGRYELVNLEHSHRFDLAKEETGEIIKAVPERRQMLAISAKQWEDVKVKTQMAVKNAGQ
jgi:hypothetical protein